MAERVIKREALVARNGCEATIGYECHPIDGQAVTFYMKTSDGVNYYAKWPIDDLQQLLDFAQEHEKNNATPELVKAGPDGRKAPSL